jgi:TniQ
MSITERFEVELWEPRPPNASAALGPCADEALVSWLHRYATPFVISPSLLLFDRTDAGLLRNIDWWRKPDPQLCTQLTARTGVARSALATMTFQDWTPHPWTEEVSTRVLCYRRFQRLRPPHETRQWFTVCPQCLATDATPYVRKTWTVEWASVCQIHAQVLVRKCPKCHEAMHFPHFNADECFTPERCRACGFVLSNASQRPAHPIVVQLQALLFAHRANPTVPLPLIGALQWPTAMAFLDKLLALVWADRACHDLEPLFARIRGELELADELRKGHYEGLLILSWLLDQWPQNMRLAMNSLGMKGYLRRPRRWPGSVVSTTTLAIEEILAPLWCD